MTYDSDSVICRIFGTISGSGTRNFDSCWNFCPPLTEIPKNSKMIICWWNTKEKFIWRLIMQQRRWQSIDKISGCKYVFTPKIRRKSCLKPKSSSYMEQMLIFSLNSTILLRSSHTRMLVDNAFRSKKLRNVKFSSKICTKSFNLSLKLSFN